MKIKNTKNKGFSMVELMYALTIGVALMTAATIFYNKQQEKSNFQKQANNLVLYSKNVVNFANANQAAIFNSGSNIKTINSEQLNYFKYITDVNKYVSYDANTKSKLIPCTSLFVQNGKMQGFTYFRTDDVNLSLANYQAELKAGKNNKILNILDSIRYLGDNAALLSSDGNGYVAKSLNGSWSLNNNLVNQYLIQNGQDYLQINGLNMSCSGKYIAVPSILISMNNYLSDVNSEVKTDNIVQQNNNNIFISNTNNSMSGLNLDSQDVSTVEGDINSKANSSIRNSLIFETNKNCEMNPAQLSTMQDYDPNYNGDPEIYKGCSSLTSPSLACSQLIKPNIFGCRNKQLSLSYSNGQRCLNETIDNRGNVKCTSFQSVDNIVTTGFTQVQGTQNSQLNLGSYLGGLSSNSIQTTAEINYGDSCSLDEVGSIAKQAPNNDPNNFYKKIMDANQGILVCQKSPLCSTPTDASTTIDKNTIPACWLSTTKTTIEIDFAATDKVISFTAPKGFAILDKSGFEPTYQPNSMFLSSDIRDYRDGGRGNGKGFSQGTNLEGYDGSDGGGGTFWGDLDSSRCHTKDCGIEFWFFGRKCKLPHSADARMIKTVGLRQENGEDYIYFSSIWLNQSTIENDTNINKGFMGGVNGVVYTDRGSMRLLSQNILQYPTSGKTWDTNRGVFKWSKTCYEPATVASFKGCSVNIYGYVPTPNCNNENCMVWNKFSVYGGYPRALNAMMTLRVPTFRAGKNDTGGARSQGCKTWQDAIGSAPGIDGNNGKIPEVFAYPHYITKVVITNDLSEIPLVENISPAPQPPSVVCNANNVTQQTKNMLISNADLTTRSIYDTNTGDSKNIYLNPNQSSYSYTSSNYNGIQCNASLVADNCYITDNNQCKYYLQSVLPTNYVISFSENISMENPVLSDENGEFHDFSVGKNLYAKVTQNGAIVENGMTTGIVTSENNISLDKKNPTVITLQNGNNIYGQYFLLQVPNSCNKALACTSPSELKGYTENGDPILYAP